MGTDLLAYKTWVKSRNTSRWTKRTG